MSGRASWVAFTLCMVVVALALGFIALVTAGLCENCTENDLVDIQLAIALVGLVPVTMLVDSVWRPRSRGVVRLWAALSVLVYVSWAVLNDAAVHGWNDLVLVP
jgi:hypothetical protein